MISTPIIISVFLNCATKIGGLVCKLEQISTSKGFSSLRFQKRCSASDDDDMYLTKLLWIKRISQILSRIKHIKHLRCLLVGKEVIESNAWKKGRKWDSGYSSNY